MADKIAVLIDRAPSMKIAEKLRMALGLTLADGNEVEIFFIGDGLKSLALSRETDALSMSEIAKHLETLLMSDVPFLIEDARELVGVGEGYAGSLERLGSKEFARRINGAKAIL